MSPKSGESEKMEVKELIHRSPITVSETATLQEAAQLLIEETVGALLVTKANTLIGIVTERDIIAKIAEGEESTETLQDLIVLDPFSVTPATSVVNAAELMAEKWIRHLPVLDENGLYGIISIRDLMTGLLLSIDSKPDWSDLLLSLLKKESHKEEPVSSE